MLTYDVVVPVKLLAEAKTRLAPSLDRAARADLARAFVLDTIDAALAAERVNRVIVVGDLSGHVDEVPNGVVVVAEPEPRSLTAAIRHGITEARRLATAERAPAAPPAATADHDPAVVPGNGRAPRSHRGIAVLLGDLPALTPQALDAALGAASRHPLAFMPDAEGTGTTLAAAAAHTRFEPAFGADSALLHRTLGFHDLSHEVPAPLAEPMRRDVDTIAALDAAVHLGVGAHTAAALAAREPAARDEPSPASEPDARASSRPTDSTRKGAA
ncbi:2-phospho-L-lactate guanylyltransferase [Agromyces sp. CF514]|uniref:2-phospho-L-lactate guanylyltransferase n=1 Tax=Agromyces sp. CF514 TaxID=1881031 RepID=UPI0008E06691|nr:2-phospho-L-lactate guanylyltransferase [Agromyces sp. CF514]SFR90694.1 2-phospho-L-lactate guanylyltransferase [Agromyces sp. CF514]